MQKIMKDQTDKKSVVVCVLFNIFNDSSCAGQWYLPAGRMEPGESIVVSIVAVD